MKMFYFNTEFDVPRIFPNDNFYMRFNPRDRRWYTKEELDDPNFDDSKGFYYLYDRYLPLRSKKAGRFEKLHGSQPPHETFPIFLNLNGRRISVNK